MKTIFTLYGGWAQKVEDINYGDVLTIDLLDTAVTLLIGNDYLKTLRDKNNQIKIKMSNSQYSSLHISNISLLFTNYFNYDNIKLYDDKLDSSGGVLLDIEREDLARKTTVTYKNKRVEIFTSCH